MLHPIRAQGSSCSPTDRFHSASSWLGEFLHANWIPSLAACPISSASAVQAPWPPSLQPIALKFLNSASTLPRSASTMPKLGLHGDEREIRVYKVYLVGPHARNKFF